MDIQPVFNEYKTMTFMCQYLSKTEDRCLQERKALRKSSQGRLWEQHASSWHHENNCQGLIKYQQCSVQEAVYNILLELKLKRIFPAVYFINTNPGGERAQLLLSEKELGELTTRR